MEVGGQLYPQGKGPWYPLDRRLGGPQSRSGRGGEEKILSHCRESNPRTPIVQSVAQRYTNWANHGSIAYIHISMNFVLLMSYVSKYKFIIQQHYAI
jgi:hypothetical protein